MPWNKYQWWQTQAGKEPSAKSMDDRENDLDDPLDRSKQNVVAPCTTQTKQDTLLEQNQKGHASLSEQIGNAQIRVQYSDSHFAVADAHLYPTNPPNNSEKLWAQDTILNEVKQINTVEDAKPTSDPEEPTEKKTRRKRKGSGRNHQIMTRLTASELVTLQRRVSKSGLAQGEYLRRAALHGQIVIEEHSVADIALLDELDELALIRAELGRQGGLLKMVIKPNEGQRELAPQEWTNLIATVRDLEQIKKQLTELETRILNGNTQT